MKLTKTLIKYLLTAGMVFITAHSSFAGGFPVRPGRLLLSPSVNYFFADKQWDSVGVKRPFAGNGKFNSLTVSLYAEYGISRRFSAVVLLPYVTNTYQQTGYSHTSSGLTDLETGIKYYLANIDYKYYFSLQGTVISPLYTDKNLGYEEEGGELKLSFAGTGNLFNRSFYFNLDNGVRQYFGASGPIQDRYNGTFGYIIDRQFKEQVTVSLGGFYTYSNYKKFNLLNPSATKNFAFNQVSVSYGQAFITGGQFLTGRNTGDGSSASLSLIYRIN
jgi:hypothetical protein